MGKRRRSQSLRCDDDHAWVGKGLDEGSRSLVWDRDFARVCWILGREGVVPMVQHALGEAGTVGGSLDAEVSEHGVGLPSPKELDHVLVHACAEERGGAARAQAASRDEVCRDSGIFFQ